MFRCQKLGLEIMFLRKQIQIFLKNLKNLACFYNVTYGIFGVADYKSEVRIQKFKMTDSIWPKILNTLLDFNM